MRASSSAFSPTRSPRRRSRCPRLVWLRSRQRGSSKARAGGADGAVDVGGVAAGGLVEHLAGGRVGALEVLAGLGLDRLAVDEVLQRWSTAQTWSVPSDEVWTGWSASSPGARRAACGGRRGRRPPGSREWRRRGGRVISGVEPGSSLTGHGQRGHGDPAQVRGDVGVAGCEHAVAVEEAVGVVGAAACFRVRDRGPASTSVPSIPADEATPRPWRRSRTRRRRSRASTASRSDGRASTDRAHARSATPTRSGRWTARCWATSAPSEKPTRWASGRDARATAPARSARVDAVGTRRVRRRDRAGRDEDSKSCRGGARPPVPTRSGRGPLRAGGRASGQLTDRVRYCSVDRAARRCCGRPWAAAASATTISPGCGASAMRTSTVWW